LRNDQVPIGIIPEKSWKRNRLHELQAAIERYQEAGLNASLTWAQEYTNLLNELAEEPRRVESATRHFGKVYYERSDGVFLCAESTARVSAVILAIKELLEHWPDLPVKGHISFKIRCGIDSYGRFIECQTGGYDE